MGLLDGIGNTIVSTGLGLALQNHNNRVQLKQQGKLGEQQLNLDLRKMDAQRQQQMRMWQDTNYSAQMEQMKKAGLSPGLMYGLGGGGGTTTGADATGVGQPGAREQNDILGMQLIQAQRALLEAQTQKTTAEAEKIAGPDTRLAKLTAQMYSDSYEATYGKAIAEWGNLEAELQRKKAEGQVAEGTIDTEIQTKEAELVGILLTNELRKSQKDLTEAQMQATVESIAQKWKALAIEKGYLDIERFVQDVANSTKLTVEAVKGVVSNLEPLSRIRHNLNKLNK